ncbi:MAG: DUF4255 domain-containing protein [Candidatus Promineifilaceae bacterium]|nr:DUF4255 domain-containing protein [Candidatus Promineifilaceae bacterium]
MSSYKVIARTSTILRQILWQSFAQDNEIRSLVPTQAAIVLLNPTQTALDSANRLSLWLYRVHENEFMKNRPMLRATNGNGNPQKEAQQFPPLALDLHFLVTPFGPSGQADHLILGKTMQLMYDNAVLLVRDVADGIVEELRLILCPLKLEELTRIWESLREPYRLSVCYQVKVTRIDSERLPGDAHIIDRIADIDETEMR